ncbi:MAG: LEA type 2 family protein [Gammaproteobacteria bacterium]|nr:LEA type 2 family protein [Gammaproteobacteria bacterium]
MKHTMRHLLWLLAVCLLAACAELSRHAETIKPTARLTDTRLANISFEQADLVFDLAVQNQNPFAINLAGLEYDLKIENRSLISGVTAQGLKIKPAATSTVQLPVTLKFADLKKLPGELWQQDKFSYQLDSRFIVDLPVIGNYAIPVAKQGELPVPRLPRVSLKDVTVGNLSLSSADLVARVEIENPNAFDLVFTDFDYRLKINRQDWGHGSIKDNVTVPEKGRSTIDIPVKLDMLSMGRTVYQVLAERQALEYQLSGEATLDTGLELLRNFRMPLDVEGKASLN